MAARDGRDQVARLLLEAGADRKAKQGGRPGYTALELAAESGNEGVVRILLEKSDSHHFDVSERESALVLAAKNWHPKAAHMLIDDEIRQQALNTALFEAVGPLTWDYIIPEPPEVAEEGWAMQIAVLKLLMDAGANPNFREQHSGQTALHRAAGDAGMREAVQLLLERGADVHISDLDGRTPLFQAVRSLAIVKLLIQKGAVVTVTDNSMWTPLHRSAFYGPSPVVQFLLDHEADPVAKDADKETPLHKAAEGCQTDIIRILTEYGADVNERTSNDWTPLIFAANDERLPEERFSTVNFLLERGADVRAQTMEGWTALHRAVVCQDLALVELLLQHGADTTAEAASHMAKEFFTGARLREHMETLRVSEGSDLNPLVSHETALHWVAERGPREVVQLLLDYGADVNARDSSGATPLIRAVKNGKVQGWEINPDVIKLLLENGAEEQVKDVEGKTARDWARDRDFRFDWERRSIHQTVPVVT